MMFVFVDSNVLLSFYHFSNDDLNELQKMEQLIRKKELALIVTEQVINEVNRNREAKIYDAFDKFSEGKVDIKFPQMCKAYPEYAEMNAKMSDLKQAKANLINALRDDILLESLPADKLISQLFTLSDRVAIDPYIEKAKLRYELGNPPGKNNSYGDAINWETLLGHVPNQQNLFFISDDKDYKSVFDESVFKPFLLNEWKEKKNSQIFYYNKLSAFFDEHHADIQLSTEKEKEALIEQLFSSGSFRESHQIVEKLSKMGGFTFEQISSMLSAALLNSQIYSIAQDDDINSFFNSLILGKEASFQPEFVSSFNKIFNPTPVSPFAPAFPGIKIEDLPF